MSRGLGAKQLEMLEWLKEQWAQDHQPTREQLKGAFVVDNGDIHRWAHSKHKEQGLSLTQARALPDCPVKTPRPVSEAYNRAVRTLVDRGLVSVVTDNANYYRYCNPEAENPLQIRLDCLGRERPHIGEETGRRRQPAVSRAEQRRQALLKALPPDGSWIKLLPLTKAFWLEIGYDAEFLKKLGDRSDDALDSLLFDTRGYQGMRVALQQLQQRGLVEVGTIVPWRGSSLQPKLYRGDRVMGARLSVAQQNAAVELDNT